MENELVKISPCVLSLQIKLYPSTISDANLLNKISKFVPINETFIKVNRNILNEILKINPYKMEDLSISMFNIEYLIYKLIKKHNKLEIIVFEVDEVESFTRIVNGDFNLNYKITNLELKMSCKYYDSYEKFGFNQYFWYGYFNEIPKKLYNLKGLEVIFNDDILNDNPKTIIKLKKFEKIRNKLLNCL